MKILWGPYDHQRLDFLLQEQLKGYDLRSFGSNGTDIITDLSTSADQILGLWQPDLVIVLEPFQRLFSAAIFQLDRPVFAVSSRVPVAVDALALFDALISLWNPPAVGSPKPVETWFPMRPLPTSLPAVGSTNKLYTLACRGSNGLDLEWRQALDALDQPWIYLNDLNPEDLSRCLQQSQVVFVSETMVVPFHFDVLASGAYLFYPAEAEAVTRVFSGEPRAIACRPEQLQSVLSELLKRSSAAMAEIGVAVPTLAQIVARLCSAQTEEKTSRNLSAGLQERLFEIWSYFPVQEEMVFNAFHNVDIRNYLERQPLLQAWYSGQAAPGTGCWCIHTQSDLALPVGEIQSPLLNRLSPNEYRLWRQLSLRLMCAERGDCQELEMLPELLLQLIAIDLKQVLDFLKDCPEYASESLLLRLIAVCPDDLTLRALRSRFPASKQDPAFVSETLSLLKKTLSWWDKSLDILAHCLPPSGEHDKANILWYGPVDTFGSFQVVNRAFLKALHQSPRLEMSLIQGVLPQRTEAFADLTLPQTMPDVLVSHIIPHLTETVLTMPRVGIMPWEYGLTPIHSVRVMQAELDEVWVPSAFNRDVHIRSGVDPDKIRVIPNGVDTKIYTPEGPCFELATEKTFKFLYVGGTVPRKGFDILLKAYSEAFTAEDDVCLVVKDFGSKAWYAATSLLSQAKKNQGDSANPEILILEDNNLSDDALASLYRACDVYVHPYRGEGFGMGILEAMSCGLPAVVPSTGPAPEFCPLACAWHLPVLTHFMFQAFYLHSGNLEHYTVLPSFYDEPDLHALKSLLKSLPTQTKACHEKGRTARQQALTYDWKNCAALVEQRLLKLAQLPEAYRVKHKRLQALVFELEEALEQDAAQALIQTERVYTESDEPGWECCWLYVRALWHADQSQKLRPILAQAIESGLPFSELMKHPLWSELWTAPRVYFLSCALPSVLLRPDLCVRVSKPEEADICLSDRVYADCLNIAWNLDAPGVGFIETWAQEHWNTREPLDWRVPNAVDFAFFEPQALDAKSKATILSVIDWSRPYGQKILQTCLTIFARQRGELKLVLASQKPGTQAEKKVKQALQAQKSKIAPNIELEFVDWPTGQQEQKDLFKDVRLIVNLDPQAEGIPLLIAQAMGVRVVSTDHFSHLKKPYAELLEAGHEKHLAWLLPRLLSDKRTRFDGLAVRSHLKEKHDQAVIGQHLFERLARIWLQETLS